MNIKRFSLGAALMVCGAVAAAPQQPAEPGTSRAPAAAAKPCPQHAARHGERPVEQGMPCPAMQGGAGQAATTGPHVGPGPGTRQGAPAGATGGARTVYGWQLMTPQERAAYHAKLRAAKTEQERAALRAKHHQEMLQRARQEGVTLPEVPPPGA